jgi:hypothetical protein
MTFTTGHALVIGIGRYQHIPRWNVPMTVRDAEAVAAVLRDPQLGAYPAPQVRLLRAEEATRERVLAELDRLAGTIGEEHTLFLFYSGHGEYSDNGAYHLSTHDTQLTGSKKIAAGSAISHQELIDRLQQVRAKRVLLIFNACHAGNISPSLGGADEDAEITGQAIPASTASALLSTGAGRVIITACRENQVSYIGEGQLTRFTAALVDGLRGRGDVTSRSGYISAYDLYLHTYYAVRDLAARLNQEQEPELTVLKGVGPFAVALYRGAVTLGALDEDEAPPSEGAVREVRPERSRAALNVIMSQVAGRDVLNIGGDYVAGDKVGGDKVGGDKITTGSVSGSGIAIGRGAQGIDARGSQGFINKNSGPVTQVYGTQRNINTGGGDYAEGNIDKRQGTTVQGDQFNLSGSFSGAVLNIKSTLSNVTQMIGASGHDAKTRNELQQLTQQLDRLLQQVPADRSGDAELVTKRVEALVEEALKPTPDVELVAFNAERLRRAADVLAPVLPNTRQVADQIIALVSSLRDTRNVMRET